MWRSQVPLCNFSPSVAENGGEKQTVSHLWWQTWRPRLQDEHKTFKSQQEQHKSVTPSVCDWRGSDKVDITVFTSLETASGFWLALLQEDSSLPTTFTARFWEVLPFSHLLFVIYITQKISRHEREHLLERAGGQSQAGRGCCFAWKLNNTSGAHQRECSRLVSNSTKGVCSDSQACWGQGHIVDANSEVQEPMVVHKLKRTLTVLAPTTAKDTATDICTKGSSTLW